MYARNPWVIDRQLFYEGLAKFAASKASEERLLRGNNSIVEVVLIKEPRRFDNNRKDGPDGCCHETLITSEDAPIFVRWKDLGYKL